MNLYNTEKEKLIIREYGRNTQNMIAYAKTIEDKQKRQECIESIIDMIMMMYPDTRNVEDYKLKVWSHVLQMADYELDVDVPDHVPSAKDRKKPEVVKYPNLTRRYRHYGRHVRTMIAKAKKMEDPEKKAQFIAIIGSYMKMVYKEHNRENVNDAVIFEEFKALSNNELEIPEGTNIDIYHQRKNFKNSNNSNNNSRKDHKNKKHKNSRNNNNSKNRKR